MTIVYLRRCSVENFPVNREDKVVVRSSSGGGAIAAVDEVVITATVVLDAADRGNEKGGVDASSFIALTK